jgi:hypothetical protein
MSQVICRCGNKGEETVSKPISEIPFRTWFVGGANPILPLLKTSNGVFSPWGTQYFAVNPKAVVSQYKEVDVEIIWRTKE